MAKSEDKPGQDFLQRNCDNTKEMYHGSEDMLQTDCDPCLYEKVTTDAAGYCHDCSEFLCQQCILQHRRFQAFRNHHILCGDSMPKQKTRKTNSKADIFKYCDDHKTNEVQFYCNYHKAVFCKLCKTTKHLHCDSSDIKLLCKESNKKDFIKVAEDLSDVKKEFEKLKLENIKNIDRLKLEHNKCRSQMITLRQKMTNYFDKIENSMEAERSDAELTSVGLKENVSLLSDAINHLSFMQEHTDAVQQTSDTTTIFAALVKLQKIYTEYATLKFRFGTSEMKNVYSDIWTCLKDLQDLFEKLDDQKTCKNSDSQKKTSGIPNDQNHIATSRAADERHVCGLEKAGNSDDFTDEGDLATNEIKPDKDSFAYIQCEANKNVFSRRNEETQKPRKPTQKEDSSADKGTSRTTNTIKDINLKDLIIVNRYMYNIESGEDITCDITGSVFLDNGFLILCDHKNSRVLLLDQKFHVLDTLYFRGNPWDVALVNKNQIITSVTNPRTLTFVRVEDSKLIEGTSINLKRVAWGIATFEDKLFISFHNNPGQGKIEVRSLQGKILETIALDGVFTDDKQSPFYVAVHQRNGDIYFTDARQYSLSCVNIMGKTKLNMQAQEFRWPRKVILDEHGNCLLCASQANKVLLITNIPGASEDSTSEPTNITTWITCKRPQTVSVRKQDGTVIVGLNSSNQILVLQCS